MTGAYPSSQHIARRQARQLVSRGLPALLIGGAVLIAAIWMLAWQLADVLARTHIQQKMQDVAAKAASVLREPAALVADAGGVRLSPRARQALTDLARFRDIYRMELRDAQENVVWRNISFISHVKHTWPKDGDIVLERRNVDGLSRRMARFRTTLAGTGHDDLVLLMELDATPQIAAYHRVAMLVAKAITTVVLAAMLLMGWLLMLRAREQEALARALAATNARHRQTTDDDTAHLQRQVEELSVNNAALLRHMARMAGKNRNGAEQQRHHADARRAHGGEA